MTDKNEVLLVDCSESCKYCFCTNCSWVTGDFSQAGLPSSLGTGGWGAEWQGSPWNNPRKNCSNFWSHILEKGDMPDEWKHFFFSHLMSFRGKNTFIIYICNHKALPRASLGQEIVDGQVFTYWTCILSYSVIVRGVMGTVLIPLLGKLCHRFGHILPPWGPRGMRLQGTVCDLYALPLPSFSHGSLPWQQNSLLQGRLWDEAVSLWRGWVLVSPLFRGTWPGWGGAQ